MTRYSVVQRNLTADEHGKGNWRGRWNLSKVAPPQRHSSEIPRAELLARLDSSLDRRVTVITASAGYGKTTLAAQWYRTLRERGVKGAWLTLDDGDSSIEQLLTGLIAAFAEAGVDLDWLSQAAARGLSETPSAVAFATLLEQIDAEPGEVALVLDDYHRTHSQDINRLVNQLTRQMPANVHLLITSRERPALSLAELKAHGQLLTLDSRDLRLSVSEARRILPAELSERDVETLVERAEGWPAALQLARVWLDEHKDRATHIQHFSGGITEIADYLAEQVMIDFPEHLQSFLLQTCILERVNGDLANEVCTRDDSWQALDDLSRICSFVLPLDDRSCWYRYHHLFVEFLRERLRRRPEIDERELHARASAWYERNGCLPEAVDHARRAGDLERSAALIEEAGSWELLVTHGSGLVRNLIKGFDDHLTRFPRLQLCRIALLQRQGQLESAQQLFDQLREATDNFRLPDADRARLLERDATIIGLCLASARDAIVSAPYTKQLNRLLETLPANDHQALAVISANCCINAFGRGEFRAATHAARRGLRHMQFTTIPLGNAYLHFHEGLADLFQGRMTAAEAAYRQGLRVAEEYFGAESHPKALGNVLLAEILYQKDEIEAACVHLHDGLPGLEAHDAFVDAYATGYQTGIAHARARQDADAALKLLARGEEFAISRNLSRLGTVINGLRLQTLLAFGDLRTADKLVDTLRPSWKPGAWKANSVLWRPHHTLGMALAEHALAHSEPQRAIEVLDDLDACCVALGNMYFRVAALTLRALAQQAAGHFDRALDDLGAALEIAAPQQMRRVFLDRGQPLNVLLRSVLPERPNRGSDSKALAFARELRELLLSGAAICGTSYSSISERELEVLVLLSRGHSSKTIGRMLGTSESTIKFHLKNIYAKLQVDKRRMAVEVARRRAIIE